MRRPYPILVGIAVAALVTISAACGDDDTGSPANAASAAPATTMHDGSTMAHAPGTTETPAATDAAPMAVTVEIKDFAFVAADIRVAVGGTVTWTNSDDQQHTATGSGTFDTGAIKPNESKTVTFDAAGDFPYACSFHPFMTGTVTVG